MAGEDLTRLARAEVASAARQDRGPNRKISGLLTGTEEENAVRGKHFVDAC